MLFIPEKYRGYGFAAAIGDHPYTLFLLDNQYDMNMDEVVFNLCRYIGDQSIFCRKLPLAPKFRSFEEVMYWCCCYIEGDEVVQENKEALFRHALETPEQAVFFKLAEEERKADFDAYRKLYKSFVENKNAFKDMPVIHFKAFTDELEEKRKSVVFDWRTSCFETETGKQGEMDFWILKKFPEEEYERCVDYLFRRWMERELFLKDGTGKAFIQSNAFMIEAALVIGTVVTTLPGMIICKGQGNTEYMTQLSGIGLTLFSKNIEKLKVLFLKRVQGE